mmetsp:Transcript_70513/g.111818  ORF Transcript_70513/g.111818 Transcript_70513/m.111818 type:complete len:225 (+) Transcript_70513:884-1558(+)
MLSMRSFSAETVSRTMDGIRSKSCLNASQDSRRWFSSCFNCELMLSKRSPRETSNDSIFDESVALRPRSSVTIASRLSLCCEVALFRASSIATISFLMDDISFVRSRTSLSRWSLIIAYSSSLQCEDTVFRDSSITRNESARSHASSSKLFFMSVISRLIDDSASVGAHSSLSRCSLPLSASPIVLISCLRASSIAAISLFMDDSASVCARTSLSSCSFTIAFS